MSSGILKGSPLGQSHGSMMSTGTSALRFVQISDSHIGFDKPANTDVTGTLRAAIAKIKAETSAAGVRAAHRGPDAPLAGVGVRHPSSR